MSIREVIHAVDVHGSGRVSVVDMKVCFVFRFYQLPSSSSVQCQIDRYMRELIDCH
jgi:hypothetical protein